MAKITITDLSTRADGTLGEVLPNGSIRLDEGGVIRWRFTRDDASSASEWTMWPVGDWAHWNKLLVSPEQSGGVNVRMEAGEYEKIVTVDLNDDDMVAYWEQHTSWYINTPKGSTDTFLTPGGAISKTTYTYLVADNDTPNVTARILSSVADTRLMVEEGELIRIAFERTDFSKEMTLKVTPGSVGFMSGIYSELNDWAEPIYVRFEAGSTDPVYLDLHVPDNSVFNGSTSVGLNIDPHENVTGVFMENFGNHKVPFSSESGRRLFVTVTDDDLPPTVAVRALHDVIRDIQTIGPQFEVVRDGDIRGSTKVKLAWEAETASGGTVTQYLDMEFKQGESRKTISFGGRDIPDGAPDKDFTIRIVEAKNYLSATASEEWNKDVVTQECATVTILNWDDLAGDGVARFYNAANGAHFLTTSAAERDHVMQTMPSMTYEGEGFISMDASAKGAVAVWRFYDISTGSHFYTADVGERDNVTANLPTFRAEGTAFHASMQDGAGLTEVYRFLNSRTGDHHYTSSEAERDAILDELPDYVLEGVAFYVPDDVSRDLIG